MKKTALLAAMMTAGTILAETTPAMISLVTPVQFPSAEYDVKGLRFDLIYGVSRNFTGLDLGIANHTRGDFAGVALGGFNLTDGRIRGGQLAIVNWNDNGARNWENNSFGVQWGLLNNADTFCGWQSGVISISGDEFTGLQAAFLNVAKDLRGVQLGCYFLCGVNVADTLDGVQAGIVNYAEHVKGGCQIGLVNIIKQGGWMPVFPFLNGNF